MKILGFIGLAITILSGFAILIVLMGVIKSPPVNAFIASFIIGQTFFNGYVMAKLK